MVHAKSTTVAVIDFRRRSMALQWHSLGGTWTPCDSPPPLVHGIAFIRPSQPNICVYGLAGRLRLQVGPHQYALSENSPRISCRGAAATFGFRRRFTVESSSGGVLYDHAYWAARRHDFFRWLATVAQDPDWRVTSARQWSEGIAAAALRSN